MPKKAQGFSPITVSAGAPETGRDRQLTRRELEELQEIVSFILEKRGGHSKSFMSHFIDILSLQPLDEDSPSFRDLGFLEDRIWLSHYFLNAENKFLEENEYLKKG